MLRHGDPIALGKKIAEKRPIDPELYEKIDPRKTSKCCVVRDYECKVPIDMADTDKLARAVLNHYPDQYVAFLGDFVSNLFGKSMRTYLTKQRDLLQRIRETPRTCTAPPGRRTRRSRATSTAAPSRTIRRPTSLRWDPAVEAELLKATASGHIMSGKVPASDYFDVALQRAHIETLNEMINTYCRDGSKEVHVMAMLWWCNEQGRHLCEDLQLLRRPTGSPTTTR